MTRHSTAAAARAVALSILCLAAPTAALQPVALALAPADGAPGDAVIGVATTVPLVLTVEGPAGATPPGEVRLSGGDSAGGRVTFHPNPLPLEPGRRQYAVDARYAPAELGARRLAIAAEGPLEARGRLNLTVEAVRDAVTVRVGAPGDADARWRVPVPVEANTTRLDAASVSLRFRARYAGADPGAWWTEPAGDVTLSTTARQWAPAFTARHGAGRYAIVVEAAGSRAFGASRAALVDVAPPAPGASSAEVRAVVEDAPTRVELTGDSVNADGKRKYPGQELITRVRVTDENGLGGVDAVLFAVRRLDAPGGPVVVRTARHPVGEAAWSLTEATVEDRFGWRPLKDGAYDVVVTVEGAAAEPARRTFIVRDVLPSLHGGGLTPDPAVALGAVRVDGAAYVADRNLGGGPEGGAVAELGVLTATVYRGSRALEEGVTVHLGGRGPSVDLTNVTTTDGRFNYSVRGGDGVLEVPLRVLLSEGAEPGEYRVAVDHEEAGETRRLGSVEFAVAPPPRATAVALSPAAPAPGGVARASAALEHADEGSTVRYRLVARTALGAWRLLAMEEGSVEGVDLQLPESLPLDWEYFVVAEPVLQGGRVGAAANATWHPAATPPRVLRGTALVDGVAFPGGPARLVPGAVGAVGAVVDARVAHGVAPEATARLTDWAGREVSDVACRATGEGPLHSIRCELAVPEDLPAGRYLLGVRVADAGGAAVWEAPVSAAPWLDARLTGDLDLVAGDDGALTGVVDVVNAGNVPVRAATLRLAPFTGDGGDPWRPAGGGVTLLANGEPRATAAWRGGAATLALDDGAVLQPGERAALQVTVVPPRGLAPGAYATTATLEVARGVPR